MTEKAKEHIQPYVKELIKCVTHLEPGDDKFSHFEHYALSKIWNQKFVAVDRHAIKKSYEGIVKKFTIHGFSSAADRLKALVDKASTSKDWENYQQNDIQWYVMCLLLHLSYSPTSTVLMDYDAIQSDPVEETDDFDWPAYLLEDQPDFISLSGGSETEDECLSFDELQGECSSLSEDILLCDSEDLKKKQKDECSQPVTIKSGATEDQIWTYVVNTTKSAQKWLKENVQHPYVAGYRTQSKFISANFAEFCEAQSRENTENKQPTELMSEYRVLREILWALQAPPSPTLCLQNDWKALLFCDQRCIYRARDTVTIPSLTKGSFQSHLRWLGQYVSLVREMEEFIAEVTAARDLKIVTGDPDNESGQEKHQEHLPPLTYEAYASALKDFLLSFKEKVLAVERKVKHQNETYTLLSMNSELRPAFKELTLVHGIHQKSICCWKKYSNWQCACRLLTMLYGALLSSSNDEGASICYEIFMKTFQPYLEIIHIWLTEGRLEDWREEFIIAKNEPDCGNTENFWKEGFVLHSYEEALLREGVLGKGLVSCFPFGLLYLIEEKVLLLGKSMELLQRLECLSEVQRSIPSFTSTLHDELLSAVHKELGMFAEDDDDAVENLSSISKSSDNDCSTQNSIMESLVQGIENTKDYYLKMALKDILRDANNDEITCRSSSDKPQKKRTTVPAVLPIKPVIERQLKRLLESRHGMSSTIVRTLLVKDFALANHLLIIRRIFLMEAGDLMHNFYTHLFEQAEVGEMFVDSLSLTNHLQECVSARYPDAASNFSVAVSLPSELDTSQHTSNSNSTTTSSGETLLNQVGHICINYAVQWPVNMVLNAASMESYNSVFQFLLKVRWALWSLQQLRFCELTGSKTGRVPKDFDVDHESGSLPISAKIHRLQLLRAWLLHFVSSVHAYLMGQVLHVLGTKLEADLESACDIDSIILVHEKYLEVMFQQCLQPKNSDVIKMAIIRVLEISMVLCRLWKQPALITSIQLCDMENQYIRHHVFLARVLSNFMQHGYADHLKTLTSALVHSFPSH